MVGHAMPLRALKFAGKHIHKANMQTHSPTHGHVYVPVVDGIRHMLNEPKPGSPPSSLARWPALAIFGFPHAPVLLSRSWAERRSEASAQWRRIKAAAGCAVGCILRSAAVDAALRLTVLSNAAPLFGAVKSARKNKKATN